MRISNSEELKEAILCLQHLQEEEDFADCLSDIKAALIRYHIRERRNIIANCIAPDRKGPINQEELARLAEKFLPQKIRSRLLDSLKKGSLPPPHRSSENILDELFELAPQSFQNKD